MAYTTVNLPADTWVEVQAGPAEGLFIPSPTGNVRIRTETSAPSAGDAEGIPTQYKLGGNNFEIASGTSLYARAIRKDAEATVNIAD